MTMYLAQATGSCIVTDDRFRWAEISRTVARRSRGQTIAADFVDGISKLTFQFPQSAKDIEALASDDTMRAYPTLMQKFFNYLLKVDENNRKPNFEAHLAARFLKMHEKAQRDIQTSRIPAVRSRISCTTPVGGVQDNSVNRLLLLSSADQYLPSVPMAFFIKGN